MSGISRGLSRRSSVDNTNVSENKAIGLTITATCVTAQTQIEDSVPRVRLLQYEAMMPTDFAGTTRLIVSIALTG